MLWYVKVLSRLSKQTANDVQVEAWLNNTQVIGRNPNGWGSSPLPNEPEVCLVFLKGWARLVCINIPSLNRKLTHFQ